jgi:toxin-antitoxin system PIN domain toxin
LFVVDTNLLLYAVNPESVDHDPAYALLEEWRAGDRPWFLTWGIIYEFLRVSTHPAVFPRPLKLTTAREWLNVLLACPSAGVLVETERHDQVLNEVVRLHPRIAGNVVHDLHTAVLMREHGVPEIMTADTDFHQFKFLEVVNPLREG